MKAKAKQMRKSRLSKSYQKELDRLAILNLKYKEQLDRVVDHLEKVYGKTPYEVDCDYFIDAYCVGKGKCTINDLHNEMIARI